MKLIYLAKILDGLNTLAWIGILAFLPFMIFFASFLVSESDEERKKGRNLCKPYITGIFLCSLFIVFCPTKREFYEIYGIGKIIEYIESNEQTQQLPDKAVNILDAWFDDYLKDE